MPLRVQETVARLQGALRQDDGSTSWRVWAPWRKEVRLVTWDGPRRVEQRMHPEPHGYYAWSHPGPVAEGTRYAYRVSDDDRDTPDPASRWQPDGVHAPSAVWYPDDFAWTDSAWRGIERSELIIYELHVGTFTPEGTFDAVMTRLPELVELGVTAIEIMPVAQFAGARNWGYDGVAWFAAQSSYGGPRALQRLVDACHAHGLAAILDVVYNHLGPEGNYLGKFGPYFNKCYHTPWGDALNYDDRQSTHVRALVLQNVRQWIRDFHFDGLRLDAIHAIWDHSPLHLLAEIGAAAREEGARVGRRVHVIAESNLNDVRLLDPLERGGFELDAQWSDDFHHCVHALLTGEKAGYYADYGDQPRQLAKSIAQPFVYDGTFSEFRARHYGAPPKDHPGDCFVVNVQTHDQVGNRALGERLTELVDPPREKLAAGLMLLSPYTPLLFMGEEYGETARFPFFCDFQDKHLRDSVRRGRREEFAAFGWHGEIPDPQAEATFRSSIISWRWPEETGKAGQRRLYQDLIALRRAHPALRDFVNRRVDLVPVAGEPALLRLRRGDPERPESCLEAWFNLTSAPLPLPEEEPGTETLFDSTDSRYDGPGAASSQSTGRLAPHGFVVRGRRAPASER